MTESDQVAALFEAERPGPLGVAGGPEDEAELADSIGAALLVLLDTLSPAERMAFVLHDQILVAFDFTVVEGLIADIELLADPETIDQLEVVTDVASDVP